MSTLELSFLDGSSSFLQLSRTTIKALMSLIFRHTWPPTIELAALECLKYSVYNVLTILAHSFFIWSSSFLYVTRTFIKVWMSLNLGQISWLTVELSALCIQISFILEDNQNLHNILSVWIYSWSLFLVQSYLPLSILNYGVSEKYNFMQFER